ncbi:MAG: hypothetical protein WCF94_01130 [bacterium]
MKNRQKRISQILWWFMGLAAIFCVIPSTADDRLMQGIGHDSGDYSSQAEIKYTQRSVTDWGKIEDTNTFLYGVDFNLFGKKGAEGLHLSLTYRDGTGQRSGTSGMENLPHQERPEPYFVYDERTADTDQLKAELREVIFLSNEDNHDVRLELGLEYERNSGLFRGRETERFNHLQIYSNNRRGDYGWILGWTTTSFKVPDYLNLRLELSSNSNLENGNRVSVFIRLMHQEILGSAMDCVPGCMTPQSLHPHDGSGTSLDVGFRHLTKISEDLYLRCDGLIGCDDGTHGYAPASYSLWSIGPEWYSKTGHSAISLLLNAFSPIQDRGDGRGDEAVWFSLGWRFWF